MLHFAAGPLIISLLDVFPLSPRLFYKIIGYSSFTLHFHEDTVDSCFSHIKIGDEDGLTGHTFLPFKDLFFFLFTQTPVEQLQLSQLFSSEQFRTAYLASSKNFGF